MLERARNSFADDSATEDKLQASASKASLSSLSACSADYSSLAESPIESPVSRQHMLPITSLLPSEFRESNAFAALEQTVTSYNQLLLRPDRKFDFDSDEGLEASKAYLDSIERLMETLQVVPCSRFYRKEFTHAYRVLYVEGSLSFLTEIIDSAQESIPYLWVNGEKYVFSSEVIHAGTVLYEAFASLNKTLQTSQVHALEEAAPTHDIVGRLRTALAHFDNAWTEYEHMYVLELMVIEADARRFISKAIELDARLSAFDKASRRLPDCVQTLHKLVRLVGKINSVANTEGRGRDDLTADILTAAEALVKCRSRSVQKLALSVKKSFQDLRNLFKKYALNIEEVDPQLKNNEDLVQALLGFERSWEKAKTFLLNPQRTRQLTHFAQYIEALLKKSSVFKEQVECRDAEVFITIPSLLVLLRCEGNDKDLCKFFCPSLEVAGSRQHELFSKVQTSYRQMRGVKKERLEQYLLTQAPSKLEPLVNNIKELSMELQRHNATDWNLFLDVLLC